jgi:molybdopterin molybdotransferase
MVKKINIKTDRMIKFESAYNTVMGAAFSTGSEEIHFMSSAGRVLIQTVKSDVDMPPFNKSAVDGYACRHEDLGKELKMIELIAAGAAPQKSIEPGTCSRIMTGAAVPVGADYVFMLEESEETTQGIIRFTGKPGKANISKTSEDVIAGDIVLRPGRFIRPQDIAVMAMVGCTSVIVGKKAQVGIISTGNELVEPDNKPSVSQIRNSNAWQLLAQVSRAGAEGKYYGIASDSEESTMTHLTQALNENDMVLLTGGVSQGDFDFVPAVLNKLDLTIHFDSVAVQPGKPMTFCTGGKKIVFGLPGNPVSSFVQFEVMVRPLLAKMMGAKTTNNEIMLPLGTDYSRKSADRMAWIPATLNQEGEVVPVEYHGSAHISALPDALWLIAIPQGQSWIQKGELVSVRPI